MKWTISKLRVADKKGVRVHNVKTIIFFNKYSLDPCGKLGTVLDSEIKGIN